jgi:hypothetical protein
VSALRVRSLDEGELDGADELLDDLTQADEARASLVRLGGIQDEALAFGDGWAASVEIDGTTLLVRGEPAGASARWTICGRPDLEGGVHAARRLHDLIVEESRR